MIPGKMARGSIAYRGGFALGIAGLMLSGLAGASVAQESKQFTYDALGRLTKVESGSGPNDAQVSEYMFDKAGNRTRVQVSAPARVENGSFESPSLDHYQLAPQTPNVQYSGSAGIAVHGDAVGFSAPWHGRQVVFLQSTGATVGSVTMQAKNLIIGKTYQIAYAVSRRPGYGTNSVNVYINGTLVQTVTAPTDQGFTPFPTPSFVATQPEWTIRFEATHVPNDSATALDAVSIERLN